MWFGVVMWQRLFIGGAKYSFMFQGSIFGVNSGDLLCLYFGCVPRVGSPGGVRLITRFCKGARAHDQDLASVQYVQACCSQCAVVDSLLMSACFYDRCHVYRACVRCAAWDRCIFEFQVCARESGLSLIPRVICRVRRGCVNAVSRRDIFAVRVKCVCTIQDVCQAFVFFWI